MLIQQGALVTLRSRQLRVFVVACLYCLAGPGIAQTFPTRPITTMVPQNVGGTNDIVGRIVALKLGEVLGGGVVVENRPGAGGNIGTAQAAKAPRDGYSLMMTVSSAQAINPALYKNPGFDPVRDFTPIALIGAVPNVLVVNPAFPARTLKEFIEVTRAKPKFYQYASAGNGTLNHLLGEMLGSYAGVQLQHVPYKGIAPALNDVIGGQVPIAFATPAAVLQHLKSGRLVALGVSTPVVRFNSSQEVVDGFMSQALEVAAGVKQQLEADARRVPGLRLLPGQFMEIRQAVGTPKGREGAAGYLLAFIEELKASGFVAEALKRHGIEGAAVAPPA